VLRLPNGYELPVAQRALVDCAVTCAVEQAVAPLRAELRAAREALAAQEQTIARQAEELGALHEKMALLEVDAQRQARAYLAAVLREIHASVLAEYHGMRRPWWSIRRNPS
jgi:hypothetical protein